MEHAKLTRYAYSYFHRITGKSEKSATQRAFPHELLSSSPSFLPILLQSRISITTLSGKERKYYLLTRRSTYYIMYLPTSIFNDLSIAWHSKFLGLLLFFTCHGTKIRHDRPISHSAKRASQGLSVP